MSLMGALAFDRETTTIWALWSLIVASGAFVLGAVALYLRERRAPRDPGPEDGEAAAGGAGTEPAIPGEP